MPATRFAPTAYGSPEIEQPGPGGASAPPRVTAYASVRTAGLGEGRAATGAAATRTSRRRRTSRKRSRDPLWARLLLLFGALLMMVSGATIAGEKLLIKQVSDNINQISVLEPRHKVSIKGAVNVLLMGIDRRGSDEPTRADSIIIMHIPASHDRAYLISLPRDSVVNIPPFPKTGYSGGQERINAAFAYGTQGSNGSLANGFALLAQTIRSFSGIPIHAGAIVDFDGFRALVSALGGVHMCVDQKTTSIHIGHDRNGKVKAPFTNRAATPVPVPGVKPVVYPVGCYHMAPWQALDFVRQRDTLPDGDYGRQRHQQQFIKAVFKQALTKGLTNPTKIMPIMKALGKAVTLDLGGVGIETWINSMGGVRDIQLIKTNVNPQGQQFNSVMVNGEYRGERLSQDTLTLLRHVADDDVDTFLAAHPTWVSKG